jgi:Asp/Glu/hydantoin racemase
MARCLGVFDGNGHRIRCMELENAPAGIETDDHVSEVIPLLVDATANARADAIVIGCFSDPGVARVRAAAHVPVVGIAEAAYLAALGLGDRFGIVSLGPSSITRHRRYLEALKLDGRLAGDRSLDMTIVELVASNVVERVARIGTTLRDEDGADAIILGCAGLGTYRTALQTELGLPIIDPVQAGVALACTHADLGYPGRRK